MTQAYASSRGPWSKWTWGGGKKIKFPSWVRVDGAQRALGLLFVDIWRFSVEELFRGLRRAADRGRVQTAAPAATTSVLSTPGGKRCAIVIPTVRKPETAARTIRVCAKYPVSCLFLFSRV